ncbi:MAG TPA: hypothetical protein PKJ24_04720 [Prolixibacteraceae bacterium]|nr:hypothetical protein [Prolixibacteraceae bacterium]
MKRLKNWIAAALGGATAESRVLYTILLHDDRQEPHRVAQRHPQEAPDGNQPEPFEPGNQ